ncbi:MAG: hypothetical protein ACJAUP_001359 [Cellvibrionaceae bacterium]|jgi:hypothetical protein
MYYNERLTILHEGEINDLYGVHNMSLEKKRVSFALNDLALDVIDSIRDKKHKCCAIALLGYFKTKPIQLNPTYGGLQEDLAFIAEEYLPKFNVPRFSVSSKHTSTIRFLVCKTSKHGLQRNISNLSLAIYSRLQNPGLNHVIYCLNNAEVREAMDKKH